jgi:ADP-heptose:LPS heptosyltransferase
MSASVSAHRAQKIFFDATSRLTHLFPKTGARFLDFAVRPVVGSPLLSEYFAYRNRRTVHRIGSLRKILIIPDIHIGDAVMSQSALTAVRELYPEAHVDYVINKTARPLIDGNPEATTILPLFPGGALPSAGVLASLRGLAAAGDYDLILNFSPFIRDQDIAADGQASLNLMTSAADIVRFELDAFKVVHFVYRSYRFPRDLLSLIAPPARAARFRGVRLTLSDEAVERAAAFVSRTGFPRDGPFLMVNPDTASRFTRLPFETQHDFLLRLAALEVPVLLGEGHTEARIGERLKARLPPPLRARIAVIPADLALEAYAALIDLCEVFVSGDTGPLHLAAARKYSRSGRHAFRNRTAVLSVFGATPARMSGYDSDRPGYLPANQDAPSWSYTAGSPCRNITCLNKLYKTCPAVRCFEEVDLDGLTWLVGGYLHDRANNGPGTGKRPSD